MEETPERKANTAQTKGFHPCWRVGHAKRRESQLWFCVWL